MESIKLFDTEGVTKSNRIIHTPSSFAKENLLYVQEAGELTSLKPHVCKRENLESYLFMIVLSGSGRVKVNNVDYNVSENSCVLLDCSKSFEHESSVSNPWTLAWVHFYGKTASQIFSIFNEKKLDNCLFLSKFSDSYQTIIRKILNLSDKDGVVSELKASSLITKLLSLCISEVSNNDSSEAVRDFVNGNYSNPNLSEMIESEFKKSFDEINKKFNSDYGIELENYIIIRRFNAAKELLRFTVKEIKQVMNECGIDNEDLFRKLFKENENMTAEEYRRKWAQWIKG